MNARPHVARRPGTASPADASAAQLAVAATLAGRLPGLVAAFSTALPRLADGELAPLLRSLAARHWHRAAPQVPPPLLLRQTHSPAVLSLGGAPTPAASPPADGAAAGLEPPRLLAVKTADCVPLLALDEELGRYAALHAGWRGTADGILANLLAGWRAAGSGLGAVRLELGPHIQGCCYEVGADCLERFAAADLEGALRRREGRSYLDLAAVLRGQALRAGVPAAHVHVSAHCTYCHRAADGQAPYASYRRASHAGQPFTGTNVGLIGVLAPR